MPSESMPLSSCGAPLQSCGAQFTDINLRGLFSLVDRCCCLLDCWGYPPLPWDRDQRHINHQAPLSVSSSAMKIISAPEQTSFLTTLLTLRSLARLSVSALSLNVRSPLCGGLRCSAVQCCGALWCVVQCSAVLWCCIVELLSNETGSEIQA